MYAATNGNKVGEAKSTSYTQAQTYTVTVAAGDKVEFYTPGSATSAPTKIAVTTAYGSETTILVKLADGEADNYVLNTTGLTDVGNGYYSMNLSKNVKGAATDNELLIEKVGVTIGSGNKVGVFTDAECTTAISTTKVAPGTTLYVKLADGVSDKVLATSVTDAAVKDYSVTDGVGSFKIQSTISDASALFTVNPA